MNTETPYVISMSDFANFKRCRKLFDFACARKLTPAGDSNQAMRDGTDFHTLVANAARAQTGLPLEPYDSTSENAELMQQIADAYLAKRALPTNIVMVEEPIYTQVLPNLYIRTTLDLVYSPTPNTLCGRDYKTFAAAPSLDMDLDFQGRIYTTVLSRYASEGTNVSFEWEYVRRALGRELKGKGYVEWLDDERYINVAMVMSQTEMDTTWNELVQTAQDLVRAIKENRLYRTELKVGPHSCAFCQYNLLCKNEYSNGALSSIDIELLTTPTDPAARMSAIGILTDPRIGADIEAAILSNTADDALEDLNASLEADILKHYGPTGLQLVREYGKHERKNHG